MEIGVIVFTYNARKDLPHCLQPLLKHRLLVVDSSSTDGTPDLAASMGVQVHSIPKASFNHGLTREMARHLLPTDIVVMVTQDAYAADGTSIDKLVQPLLEGKASLAYARQLPKSLKPFEAFPRHFNYPARSHIRSLKDKKTYGSYLHFFSNSFGAYLNAALDEIGGFPETLFAEDTVVCAKLLQKGHRVAYVAESHVYHSHSYSAVQEFRRHFDIGLIRKEFKELLGRDEKRGYQYAKQFLKELNYKLVPKGLIHLTAKYAGYRLGYSASRWPAPLKKILSSQKFYWD